MTSVVDSQGFDPTDTASLERAIKSLYATARAGAESRLAATTEIEATLVNGTNHIGHGLGRPVRGAIVTPRDAVSFQWGCDWRQIGNPHPERTVDITHAGTSVTCRIVFF